MEYLFAVLVLVIYLFKYIYSIIINNGSRIVNQMLFLGHKEKTWRIIQQIQQRMIDAQMRFDRGEGEGKAECDRYVHEMTSLRNALTAETFKNLAALQGIDVKARGCTISFQAAAAQQISVLRRLCDRDIESILAQARDFRKVCPLQVPGVEGGYSEAEIEEIAGLVEGQCAEIQV